MLRALSEVTRVLHDVGASSVADWYTRTGITGLIVITILELPVLILIISSIFGNPRRWKVTGIFISLLIILVGGFIGGIFILSVLLSLIV
ncbi:MAG: hypothetical protein ACE5OO_05180 [Candidatus Bathyarchaeia archaeon]